MSNPSVPITNSQGTAAGGLGADNLISASPDHFADGGNNDSDSIRDFDTADQEIWNKVTARATTVPKNHLDIIYPFLLPGGFGSFQSDAFKFNYKTIGLTAFLNVIQIIDSVGVVQVAGLPTALQNAAKTEQIILASALTGTFTGGTVIYVVVEAEGDVGAPFTTETAQVGIMKAFVSP